MSSPSVWLGSARQPVRLLMIGFGAATALLVGGLAFSNAFLGSEIGMHQMLRPEGRLIVYITLAAVLGAVFFASVYLSDTVGAIESEPSGFFDIVSLICARLSMIALPLIVVVMFYEVISRYVFASGTLWANELSLWLAGFLFLLAGLYAMQQRSHIRIYIIYDMMPRWMQKLSDCISVFLIWVFTICLFWGGYNEAKAKFLRMETFGTAWDPPIPATIKPAIIFMIILVAIQALSNLISDWNKAPEHHSPADEIDETEIENIRRTLDLSEEDK
ncbi:MAG: TRAP transporter small permease subunit [Pelagimonas sp.]|uniref:TRAP transporter small permease subunit n=1 Tax=Pelagimonas sp. TaxID=2073170 RepID=UPI003D6AEFDF